MKIKRSQIKNILKEFYSGDVELYLRTNAAEYRRDPNLDFKSIRMLLMDDFMDNVGHSEDIRDYQALIDKLASGEIMENKVKITKRQLRRIIKEYKEMLSPGHIDGHPWSGTLEDLAVVQGKTWGHGEVVDKKGYRDMVGHARDLTAGKAKSPVKKYGK